MERLTLLKEAQLRHCCCFCRHSSTILGMQYTVVFRVVIHANENLTKNFTFHKGNHGENCHLKKVQKVGLKIGEIH